MGKPMRTAIGLVTVGLLVLAGAGPADALVPWTGNSTGTLTFTDTTTSTPLNCVSGTQKGLATALPAGPLNTVTGSTWNRCTLPLGMSVTLVQLGTWTVTAGSVTGISLNVTGTACSFHLSGTAAASYNNVTHVLTYPGTTTTLTSSSVSGCFGLTANGDAWNFAGSYQL